MLNSWQRLGSFLVCNLLPCWNQFLFHRSHFHCFVTRRLTSSWHLTRWAQRQEAVKLWVPKLGGDRSIRQYSTIRLSLSVDFADWARILVLSHGHCTQILTIPQFYVVELKLAAYISSHFFHYLPEFRLTKADIWIFQSASQRSALVARGTDIFFRIVSLAQTLQATSTLMTYH